MSQLASSARASVRASARSSVRAFARFVPAILLVIASAACAGDDTSSATGPSDPSSEVFASALGVNLANMTERASRLYVQDIVVGTGAEATAGKLLRMRYTGWLRTGQEFDSNRTAGTPYEFPLGAGRVIAGWDIGVAGMRVGGRRRLVFGSEYGYGAQGSGRIPPNATLVFDVELVSIGN
jgi:FKBP-type peptidyl-prolyl cis-trans isomerase FkpA